MKFGVKNKPASLLVVPFGKALNGITASWCGRRSFRHYSSVFFSTDLILSNLSDKNDSRGSGGMFPRKIFENLHTARAILVHLEQF